MPHPEKYEVPERIKEIISGRVSDEEGELAEWLADCTEEQFEAYLELRGEESLEEVLGGESRDDGDEEDERY
jgi:hypothetical protein